MAAVTPDGVARFNSRTREDATFVFENEKAATEVSIHAPVRMRQLAW